MKISAVELAAAKPKTGYWSQHHINGAWLRFVDRGGCWHDIVKIKDVTDDQIKSIEINVETTTIEIRRDNGHLGFGVLKFKGKPSRGRYCHRYQSDW